MSDQFKPIVSPACAKVLTEAELIRRLTFQTLDEHNCDQEGCERLMLQSADRIKALRERCEWQVLNYGKHGVIFSTCGSPVTLKRIPQVCPYCGRKVSAGSDNSSADKP